MNLQEGVARYLKLRELKEQMKERHRQELAKISEAEARLEAWFLENLNKLGAKHITTALGTVYRSERTSAAVDDWELCLTFIRDNDLWHMLERRVAKAAVEDYLSNHQHLPPGVSMRRELTINVRKS